jgi:flagellar biosynthesis protein FliQ
VVDGFVVVVVGLGLGVVVAVVGAGVDIEEKGDFFTFEGKIGVVLVVLIDVERV